MAEASTIKLGDISKRLSVPNKDIAAKLNEFGVPVKGASSTITAEQASLLLEY